MEHRVPDVVDLFYRHSIEWPRLLLAFQEEYLVSFFFNVNHPTVDQ